MLVARRPNIWKARYEIFADGTWVTAWDRSKRSTGGQFDLGEWHYEVHRNWRGSTYQLVTAGAVVARAQASRTAWTVEAGGLMYELRRTSIWRLGYELWLHGQPAGSVRPIHRGSGDAVAELPGLPLSLQVFVLVVVLSSWSQAAAVTYAIIGSS